MNISPKHHLWKKTSPKHPFFFTWALLWPWGWSPWIFFVDFDHPNNSCQGRMGFICRRVISNSCCLLHGAGRFTCIYHKNGPVLQANIPYMEHLGNSCLVSSILSYGLSVNPEAEKKTLFIFIFPKIAIDSDYLWLFCYQVFRHTRLTQILSFAASTAFFMVLYPCFHLNDALVCFSPHLVGYPPCLGFKELWCLDLAWDDSILLGSHQIPQSLHFGKVPIFFLVKSPYFCWKSTFLSVESPSFVACFKVSGPSRERSARFNDPCFAEPGTMGRCFWRFHLKNSETSQDGAPSR